MVVLSAKSSSTLDMFLRKMRGSTNFTRLFKGKGPFRTLLSNRRTGRFPRIYTSDEGHRVEVITNHTCTKNTTKKHYYNYQNIILSVSYSYLLKLVELFKCQIQYIYCTNVTTTSSLCSVLNRFEIQCSVKEQVK